MKRLVKLVKPLILILSAAVVIFCMVTFSNKRTKLEYNEHLTDTVFTLDGVEYPFEDLAFYILYEERVVEEQARIYNPDSPKDYWNMRIKNHSFVQQEAKDAIIGMAVHDRLMYNLAVDAGMGELSEEVRMQLEYAQADFWEDLLDEQWERLPVDASIINMQMEIAAVAEIYDNYLAEQAGVTTASYKYDGYDYNLILNEHDYKLNDTLWKRFVPGDITIHHDSLNYINGLNDEEKKKK